MRRAVSILVLSSLVLPAAAAPPPAQASSSTSAQARPGPYDPAADASADLKAAAERASAGGRRVLAIVGGNWCGWCRALDGLLSSDAEVASALGARFEVVHVNFSKENRNEAVMERLGRPDKLGFPALVVLTPGLERLHLQETGSLESGDKKAPGHDREKVLAFLREWGGRKG